MPWSITPRCFFHDLRIATSDCTHKEVRWSSFQRTSFYALIESGNPRQLDLHTGIRGGIRGGIER